MSYKPKLQAGKKINTKLENLSVVDRPSMQYRQNVYTPVLKAKGRGMKESGEMRKDNMGKNIASYVFHASS